MSEFTYDDPEAGLWWHGLSEDGRAALEQPGLTYGKPCRELLALAEDDERRELPHIRVGPSRESVSPWARAGFLVIDPRALQPGEFVRGAELLPLVNSPDVFVLGSAVRRAGVGNLC